MERHVWGLVVDTYIEDNYKRLGVSFLNVSSPLTTDFLARKYNHAIMYVNLSEIRLLQHMCAHAWYHNCRHLICMGVCVCQFKLYNRQA